MFNVDFFKQEYNPELHSKKDKKSPIDNGITLPSRNTINNGLNYNHSNKLNDISNKRISTISA